MASTTIDTLNKDIVKTIVEYEGKRSNFININGVVLNINNITKIDKIQSEYGDNYSFRIYNDRQKEIYSCWNENYAKLVKIHTSLLNYLSPVVIE